MPLSFRMIMDFKETLRDEKSQDFKDLSDKVTRDVSLYLIFLKKFGTSNVLFHSSIHYFFPGSVILEVDLEFKANSTTPSNPDIVRALYTAVNGSGNVGDLILDRTSIKSETASVNTVPPLRIVTEFLLIDGFTPELSSSISAESIQLNDKINNWLKPILEKYYGQTMVNSAFANFSNSDNWIQTKVEYQFNTPIIVNPSKIIDGILASTSPVRYVRYTLKVNENQAQFDMVPFSLRILNKAFSDGLSNRGSTEFKELSTQVTTSKLFGNEKGFSEVYVMKLTKGSVVASTEVTFSPGSTSPSRVSQILLNGILSLETEGLKIDPTSINLPVLPTPRPFPGFAVAIIVLCGLAILIIPILIIVALKTGLFRKLAQAFSLRSPDYYDF
ncbi:hypothetical protein AOXY_G24099 [Acipenser oxyrinchus oxyrinchus]|uniref:SEA domain-containing protein n=1 Tax=Acipenser oxyrinchus oxyrinchus TaxID=40147 RepID=A0AAD8CVS6_ACIOX|nr:hypothetical protein AOXY_G24099 [Acipenser oxyrinchus oxyrinchus]